MSAIYYGNVHAAALSDGATSADDSLKVRSIVSARWILTGIALWCALPAWADVKLAQQRACMGCHQLDKKVVGPAFKQVAQRYAHKADAQTYLAQRIRQGGAGAWGPVGMPANTAVSPEEAQRLAAWVLQQK